MKIFTQKQNPITGDSEWDIEAEDYDYHQEIARSAFADMLHDTERNKKYRKALKRAIDKTHKAGKKAHVLDIGTGTGLLSIMAAKCGADSIVACEAFKPMADCCRKILEHNCVADKITLIPKKSTEITVGPEGDMKEKANILVTEVFDTELIGEGALSTFAHAHKNLLEEGCIVVPDSAVIYAQVVECPWLQKWNKLNDIYDEDLELLVKTPDKVKECSGSAAVHDIQLSQIPRSEFKELSEPIPVFYYDWSGRTPIDFKRTVKQDFAATNTGTAQIVFMWWDLNMDTEGKIVLSCAPWWSHPDADTSSEKPQESIPWRDHWMQAVYYLPQPVNITKDADISLISCQDEYSLWFYLEDENTKYKHYNRPICDCGVHISMSRTQISYLNDGRRSKKFLSALKRQISKDSVVLDVNGSTYYGLAAAKMNAKKVYILEGMNVNVGVINDYIKENELTNVELLPEIKIDLLGEVTNVIGDPNMTCAVLPWDNLKMAHILCMYGENLRDDLQLVPDACEFWAMPVEFRDLQKIRIPLGMCEGIDMSVFDDLIEKSRTISDAEVEAQPLWEYPCRCGAAPTRLLQIDFRDLKTKYDVEEKVALTNQKSVQNVNGFAIWAVWKIGSESTSSGPVAEPVVGETVAWDTHTRQAVKILSETYTIDKKSAYTYKLKCDLQHGLFNLSIDIVGEQ